MSIASSVEQFIRDGLFLRNWSSRTADTYRKAIVPFCPAAISTATLNAMVVATRQRNLSIGGINCGSGPSTAS